MTSIDDLIKLHGSRQALWIHLFEYVDGKLFWKNPRAARLRVGDAVGQFNARYWSCNVCNKRVYLHRIIYEMFNGDTDMEIDHIDRDRHNNQHTNLRTATRQENTLNVGLRADNTSGQRGVHYNGATSKWVAQLNENGKRKYIGSFESYSEACVARLKLIPENII